MKKRINKVRQQAPAKQTRSNVSFVNLSSYTTPEIVESRNKDWIEFGAENDYFNVLIDKAKGSATNGACINSISQMIYGKGLSATDSARRPEQYARMVSLFKKDDLRRFAYDLKLTGQTAIQVIYSKDKKTIEKVEHLPIETLRAEKCGADDKEVQAYYYFPKWEDIKPSDEPLRIPAFGVSDTPKPIEILYVKPYEAGMYYYSTPDWAKGGLQYADLEIEVSNYHINNVRNGLSPSMLINFNNGVPEKPKRDEMERQILNKYQGSSRAGTPIIAFNDNKESAATIEAIQLSDAHNQYQFLSEEAKSKILIAHRIVSPMLLGIKDNSGFGNNAEELKDSSILMQNVVIAPFQELLIDAFDKILAFNKISLNLYFKTLQPLQFLDLDNVEDKETKEEETGVKMKQMFSSLEEFGEDEDLKEWDLIDERKVDYDAEDSLDEEVDKLNNPKLSVLSKIYNFATTGAARPKAKSKQDGENEDGVQFKVRYQYAPLTFSESSREFCKKMVRAAKIYRKEDIQQMSKKAVNAGWGLKGSDNYDIWLYKGGGGCHHFWMRKTYRAKNAKTTPDVGNPNSEVSVNKAKKEGFKPEVNAKEVSKRPVDMPNKGFVNK
tara:strand:+ start:413 stop:2236 length:1824 start_codon:yes stop_codon:yes gene_type:complete